MTRAEKLKAYMEEGLTHSKRDGYFEPGNLFHGLDAAGLATELVALDDDLQEFVQHEKSDFAYVELAEEIAPMIQEWMNKTP